MALSAERVPRLPPWYYIIEVEPDVFTEGTRRPNLALCRHFRRRIDLTGCTCLDIGVQEGVGPVGMMRQGAKTVVAYDRQTLPEYVETMKRAYGVDFHYVSGITLDLLKNRLAEQGLPTKFDFVNFAGVLYHMIDPIAGLVMARSFLRKGGILLLETSVNIRNDFTADVNHHGALYPASNYFQFSIPAIDYWIRILRLEALDCAWLGGNAPIRRFIMIARAVSDVQPEADDDWMRARWFEMEFPHYGLDFKSLESTRPPIPYSRLDFVKRVYREEPERLMDLHATCSASGLYPINRDLQILRLGDQF